MDAGTYTGQNQGPWAVTGNSNYVVMAGEFRNVNFQPQQGLVRYAVSSIAPDKQGPRVSGTAIQPTLSSPSNGSVRVTWTANWDRDNTNLTYRIFRDGGSTPVAHPHPGLDVLAAPDDDVHRTRGSREGPTRTA